MSGLKSKLIKLSAWNSLAAAINFLTNLLIAKIFGVSIFGELAYLLSVASLFSLIFALIPANYSLFKYQDDPEFKYILSAFYMIASVLLIFVVLIFQFTVAIPFGLFYLFSLTLAFQGYFDISFQAENRLGSYYFYLFLISISKATLVVIAYFQNWILSFEDLVWLITLAQGIIVLYFLLKKGQIFIKSIGYIKSAIMLFWKEKQLFSAYYFNTALKKLNSNILILLFQPIVSSEILGLYALLMKVHVFITGLARTMESLMINKESYKKYASSFIAQAIPIGIVVQIGYLLVGVLYMNYIAGGSYFLYLLISSFLIYPFLYFLKSRAVFLSAYRNYHINISYLLFLIPLVFIFILTYSEKIEASLLSMVLIFVSGSLFQMIYLILREKKLDPKTGNQIQYEG